MKHKLLLIVGIAVLCGVLLFGMGWFMLDRSEGQASADKDLEPFCNIQLSVMSGDVTIEKGDSFAISYHLHGREKVKQLEVKNDTLYFDTGFDPLWKPSSGNWSVVITVPEGTEFDSLSLKSTAGDITFSSYNFQNGSFETTSGDIQISEVVCGTLRAKSVSHDISLTAAQIEEKAELETVSGDIRAEGNFEGIEAKSVGKIKLNGADQARKLSLGQDKPMLIAESVSGSIHIDTK